MNRWTITVLLLLLGNTVLAEPLYRYTNAQGQVVIEDRLPPESIEHGYTVVDSYGRIIKTVAPAKTEAQQQQQQAAKEREAHAKQALEDQRFLQQYSSEVDLSNEQARQLDALEHSLHLTQLSIQKLQAQIDSMAEKINKLETQNQPIPDAYHRMIERSRMQLAQQRQHEHRKQLDLEHAKQQYQHDLDRYRQLSQQAEP